MAMSNLETKAFLLEKVKTVDFSKTIVAIDLKVGRYRQLIEFMKGFESCTDKKSNKIFRHYFVILHQILYESFQVQGNENLLT